MILWWISFPLPQSPLRRSNKIQKAGKRIAFRLYRDQRVKGGGEPDKRPGTLDFIVKQGMARKLDPLRCKEHDPGESGTYDWVRATVHLDDCRVRLDYRCSHLDIDGSHAALTKLGNALKAAFDK